MPDIVTPAKAERADKARNRARILEAAAFAFSESGTDTQMDDIAARAGLGVGTLYRHFATKEALMGAMIRRKFSQILAVTQAALEREGEPFELLKGALRDGAEVASADAAAQQTLVRAGVDAWEHAPDLLEELLAATRRLREYEETDKRELEALRKQLRPFEDTTLWRLIVDMILLDTEKHATILRFLERHARGN
jgi:AcrR family transcriptional regulator